MNTFTVWDKNPKLFHHLLLFLDSHHPTTHSGLSWHPTSFPVTSSSEFYSPTFLQDWPNSIPVPSICISLFCSSSQKSLPQWPFHSLLSPFYLYYQIWEKRRVTRPAGEWILYMRYQANCVCKEQIMQQEGNIHCGLVIGHWVLLRSNNNNIMTITTIIIKSIAL